MKRNIPLRPWLAIANQTAAISTRFELFCIYLSIITLSLCFYGMIIINDCVGPIDADVDESNRAVPVDFHQLSQVNLRWNPNGTNSSLVDDVMI